MKKPKDNDTPEAEASEARWPKDGDRLFIESAWTYDAHIVRDPAERFYRMPMGYKRAGDILIDQAAADAADRRNIIYAALFCYRQSIELFLKRLIEEFGDRKAHSSKNTHDLSRLWERFMCILNERASSESLGLNAVQKLIEELHAADQKSDGFRFPSGCNGLPFDFGDRGIDLENVREVMQGVENFFECVYLHFLHQDESAGQDG
jgi:hypothetical protein